MPCSCELERKHPCLHLALFLSFLFFPFLFSSVFHCWRRLQDAEYPGTSKIEILNPIRSDVDASVWALQHVLILYAQKTKIDTSRLLVNLFHGCPGCHIAWLGFTYDDFACSADLEPVVEELQQAFFKLADFLGGLKSKVLGEGPGLAGRVSPAGSVSLLDTAAQPVIPASLTLPEVNESQSADELYLLKAVGDVTLDGADPGGQLEWVVQTGIRDDQQNQPDFELPTASQMPLR